MIDVFISYRRNDSGGWVRLIDERLTQVLGREHVFRDINSIAPGADFQREIKGRISGCDVALVVIGPLWATIPGPDGSPRIEDPHDLVRREIEFALQGGVVVVPVTVGDAPLPDFKRLRVTRLRRLAKLQAISMSVKHFERDLDDLVAHVQRLGAQHSAETDQPAVKAAGHESNDGEEDNYAVQPDESTDVVAEKPPLAMPSQEGEGPRALQEAQVHLAALGDRDDPLGSEPLRIRITAENGGWRFERSGSCGGSLNMPEPDSARVGHSALQLLLERQRNELSTLRKDYGEMLFRMLVPRSWRKVFTLATGISLQLDAPSESIPWEFLWAPGAPLPLGLGAALIRECAGAPVNAAQTEPSQNALVLLGGPGSLMSFSPPGAREEVESVSVTLTRAGFSVDTLLAPDPFDAISAIERRNHRLIHLSGVAVTGWLPESRARDMSVESRQPLSGLVIGDDVVLTEHELLVQDEIPEVVTIGADHVGGWARTLRTAGSNVVVLSADPLDDTAATLFFTTFYAELTRGLTAGTAMLRARLRVASDGSSSSSAVAALRLRFYGDPGYRLVPGTDHPSAPHVFVPTR
jgi:hypothetical protein